MNTLIKKITYGGLLAALVLVATRISLPLSFSGGYIHIGDGFVLLCGIILGPAGALAAGIGSALADITGGYAIYALPTFFIKALMAFIVGILMKYRDRTKLSLFMSLSYSIIWIASISVLKTILKKALSTNPEQVLIDLESTVITSVSHLTTLGKIYDIILLIIILLIPCLLFTFYYLALKGKINFKPIEGMAFVIAGTIMIILYYLTAYILYGNAITPVMDIPGNLIQFALGIVIVNLLYPFAIKMKQSINNH